MQYEHNTYLAHHGVKGMRWGVRRSKRQLGYKPENAYVTQTVPGGHYKIKDHYTEQEIRDAYGFSRDTKLSKKDMSYLEKDLKDTLEEANKPHTRKVHVSSFYEPNPKYNSVDQESARKKYTDYRMYGYTHKEAMKAAQRHVKARKAVRIGSMGAAVAAMGAYYYLNDRG